MRLKRNYYITRNQNSSRNVEILNNEHSVLYLSNYLLYLFQEVNNNYKEEANIRENN